MAFSLDRFAALRPFLFHLTAFDNLERVRRTGALESAAALIARSDRPGLLRERRPSGERVTVDGAAVHVRDQAPLHAGNVALPPDWEFEDLVEMLNQQVFFWPGGERGPIDYGLRHFGTYADEKSAILRVPFRSIAGANPGNPPRFCRFNSGAPRWSAGRAAPRGPDTFQEAAACDVLPGGVVEVTFQGRAALPPDTQFARGFAGPWQPLFG
jgi:hypothetical protein